MEFVAYDIASMDFRQAGAASRALKERLKLIGADAEAIRRTMIAAYEAEMNVVIHSLGGRLEASLSDSRVDVDVVDSGPGIPDIEKAMLEGFSTASAEARALGFGAGLGLPNIKKNSDRLRLTSRVGEGTRVSFTVELHPSDGGGTHPVSLHAWPDRCRECHACLSACPTSAMRVRDGRPSVLEHLCVDCAQCIAACPFGALGVRSEVDSLDDLPSKNRLVLVVPPTLLADCGPVYTPAAVWEALRTLGFAGVVTTEDVEATLRSAAVAWATAATEPRPAGEDTDRGPSDTRRRTPAIVPVCPAVVNLIELRFPSLVPNLAPFDSPWEAIQVALGGRPAAYVVSCPSQRSALLTGSEDGPQARQNGAKPRDEYLSPVVIRQAVLARLAKAGAGTDSDMIREEAAAPATDARPAATQGAPRLGGNSPLTVTGSTHVLNVLERIEDGLLDDMQIVEPFMCEGGCFGSPLLYEDHHVATRRWIQGQIALEATVADRAAAVGRTAGGAADAVPRRRPFGVRPGIRLDADMGRAIEKLGRLQTILDSLPGKDCCACGAPTCAALAQDVIRQQAQIDHCPYLAPVEKEGRET